MTNSEIRQLIEEKIYNEWTTTPVIFENTEVVYDPTAIWSKLVIITSSSTNAELGKKVKKTGYIILQMFSPLGVGIGQLLKAADAFLLFLSNYRFTGYDLFTYAGTPIIIGETTGKGDNLSNQYTTEPSRFYQINVRIYFEAF